MSIPQWILTNGDRLQLCSFFMLLAILAAIETIAPRRPGPMARRLRWPTNLGLTILNLVALGLLPVSIIGTALWAEQHRWGLFNQAALPMPAVVAGTLLVRGTRAFHRRSIVCSVTS
jgi:hypothetical protein